MIYLSLVSEWLQLFEPKLQGDSFFQSIRDLLMEFVDGSGYHRVSLSGSMNVHLQVLGLLVTRGRSRSNRISLFEVVSRRDCRSLSFVMLVVQIQRAASSMVRGGCDVRRPHWRRVRWRRRRLQPLKRLGEGMFRLVGIVRTVFRLVRSCSSDVKFWDVLFVVVLELFFVGGVFVWR